MSPYTEIGNRRLGRVSRARLWFNRKTRGLKKRFGATVLLAILLVAVVALILAIGLIIPYFRASEVQSEEVKASSKLDGAVSTVKQKLDMSWPILKAKFMKEGMAKRNFPTNLDNLADLIASAFFWSLIALCCVAVGVLIGNIRNSRPGRDAFNRLMSCSRPNFSNYLACCYNARRRQERDLEAQTQHQAVQQVYESSDDFRTNTEDWREDSYIPDRTPGLNVLPEDEVTPEQQTTLSNRRYSPERSIPIPMNRASETDALLPDTPRRLSKGSTLAPSEHSSQISGAQLYQPFWGALSRLFRPPRSAPSSSASTPPNNEPTVISNPPVQSNPSTHHGEDSTTNSSNSPVRSLPDSRREPSLSSESSISNDSLPTTVKGGMGPSNPANRARSNRQSSSGYGSTDDSFCTMHRVGIPVTVGENNIMRASPGIIVFKNLSEEDFSGDQVLGIEEGRIFWLSC